MTITLEELYCVVENARRQYSGDLEIDLSVEPEGTGPLRLVPSDDWPYNLVLVGDY